MLHEVKSDYRDIAKFFPELKARLSPAEHKKRLLLEAAGKGGPKPNPGKQPLGYEFREYTYERSNCYDPLFTKKIRKLRPEWFVSKAERAERNKRLILEMARKGEARPRQNKHPLGTLLSNYTSRTSSSYDALFTKKIRKLRPDWFLSNSEISKETKRTLLEMAAKGRPKPERRSSLGIAIRNYSFRDPVFDRKIRRLRPDWFQTCSTK